MPTIYVLSRNVKKISEFFYLEMFIFLVVKFSVYLDRHVFVMRAEEKHKFDHKGSDRRPFYTNVYQNANLIVS